MVCGTRCVKRFRRQKREVVVPAAKERRERVGVEVASVEEQREGSALCRDCASHRHTFALFENRQKIGGAVIEEQFEGYESRHIMEGELAVRRVRFFLQPMASSERMPPLCMRNASSFFGNC